MPSEYLRLGRSLLQGSSGNQDAVSITAVVGIAIGCFCLGVLLTLLVGLAALALRARRASSSPPGEQALPHHPKSVMPFAALCGWANINNMHGEDREPDEAPMTVSTVSGGGTGPFQPIFTSRSNPLQSIGELPESQLSSRSGRSTISMSSLKAQTTTVSPQSSLLVAGMLPGGEVTVDELARAASLKPSDPFLTDVAPYFKWVASASDSAVAVEEGVNAAQKAASAMAGARWKLGGDVAGPPPDQLSAAQVQDQLQLVANGLVGEGSTALVFKAFWVKEFGHRGLVAVKCLRDPSGMGSAHAEQSFKYEADLLSRCKHPNIIRIYGYCLAPPTMCIIMELLPSCLSHKLYGLPHAPGEAGVDVPKGRPKRGKQPRSDVDAAAQTGKTGPGGVEGDVPDASSLQSLLLQPGGGSRPGSRPRVAELLPPHEVLQLALGIASGLAHLHATPESRAPDSPGGDAGRFDIPPDDDAGPPTPPPLARVAHRDLKPSNILINSKGVPKISDFGLAREHTSTTVYTDETAVGTVRYMAPELLQGNAFARLTDKIDIYSLGVLLWEIATRTMPFEGVPDVMLATLVQSGKRPDIPGDRAGQLGRRTDAPPDSVFRILPHFGLLVKSCWQEQPPRRPKADVVHKLLLDMLKKQETAAGGGLAMPTPAPRA